MPRCDDGWLDRWGRACHWCCCYLLFRLFSSSPNAAAGQVPIIIWGITAGCSAREAILVPNRSSQICPYPYPSA
ncbi:hypothetical protein M441DRAFT_396221 [Trichoderma asperellum CBS 433.97]|uniref:Secreted protein n=1 Tax=Trichoderma asperellum (strain ATCC 204424 / CBS 433.97 / NBRC 101777) TaxID=1042311 RepID=A0A2T3Z8Z4_TRIA4|nr:hypothetical protein M441DRAFT_396221 [Trichoderma asperellum CBS 433.97]PTB41281.1 hypothetical protein M441DRAFT_396221 [Trichoderma asperellum CBS 433.97]